MLLNLDIWDEIIGHLGRQWDESTLYSLALTCRDISDLALNALWWHGGSDGPGAIVSVINSYSPSPDEPFLLHMEDHEDHTVINGGDGGPSISFRRVIGSWVRPSQPLFIVQRIRCKLGIKQTDTLRRVRARPRILGAH